MIETTAAPSGAPFKLIKVAGFSHAICYPCRGWAQPIPYPFPRSEDPSKRCAKTYDEMDACYKAILKDKDTPELREAVQGLLDKIDECEEEDKKRRT